MTVPQVEILVRRPSVMRQLMDGLSRLSPDRFGPVD
jgi:hypothetical protein